MGIKELSLEKIKRYSNYFNPDKFREKLKKYAKIIGKEPVYYAFMLYYMMISKKISRVNKAYIAGT